MRFLLLGPVLLLATVPGAPRAQGVFDMGALTDTLAIPTQPGAAPAGTPSAAQVPEAALRFKPSMDVRKRNFAQIVEKTRAASPQGAAELEKLFAAQDIIAEVGKGLAPYGLRTDDMADAFTLYWVNAWSASRGVSDAGSREQALAVRRQAVNAMRASPKIATLTDAQKQEFAEVMLIQAMLLEATLKSALANPAQLDQVKAGARQGARELGLDVDAMDLTPTGFVRAGAAPALAP